MRLKITAALAALLITLAITLHPVALQIRDKSQSGCTTALISPVPTCPEDALWYSYEFRRSK